MNQLSFNTKKIRLELARNNEDFKIGKQLFLEYSKKLDFDLCFQNFEEELNDINVQYNLPFGALVY